ncbi:MAG: hypothetical protein QGI51_04410 [Dehalococcoidales bacterium]|jgi:hypothetical protein|nr:hypothetical protein [Dehalococcoidales bacterium]MDP6632725.1 hypothetical protein [Dehalococcoidales bacterium]
MEKQLDMVRKAYDLTVEQYRQRSNTARGSIPWMISLKRSRIHRSTSLWRKTTMN